MTHYVFISDWAWPSIEDVYMLEAYEGGDAGDAVTVVVRESTSPCALNPFKTEDKLDFFNSHGLHAVSMQLLPYQTITKADIIAELRKNGSIYWPENTKILSDFSFKIADAETFTPPLWSEMSSKIDFAEEFYELSEPNAWHGYLTASQFLRYKAEYDVLKKEFYFKDRYTYKGCLNCCTADVLLVLRSKGKDYILVVQRGGVVGKDRFALVGGHKEDNETFQECANREFKEEIEIESYSGRILTEVSMLADYPYRSQVLCKPSMVFCQHIDIEDEALPAVSGKDDAADAYWMQYEQLNLDNMFEDHYAIVTKFMKEKLNAE